MLDLLTLSCDFGSIYELGVLDASKSRWRETWRLNVTKRIPLALVTS